MLTQCECLGKNNFVTYAFRVHAKHAICGNTASHDTVFAYAANERMPMFSKTTEAAEAYRRKLFPGRQPALGRNDPEYVEITENFAFDEVVNSDDLDDHTRHLAICAVLLGSQSYEAFRVMSSAALEVGVTPAELKELVYQATPYLGLGRTLPFIAAVNEVFKHRGIDLPLEPQTTVARENRREAGNQIQVEIFGEGIRNSWETGPEDMRRINEWLADNCFGDFYTRGGMSLPDREIITFCFLIAQGGCEPQAIAHAKGNFNVGNDREKLIKVVRQCIPYIGYPRALNGIACINKASEE